MEEKKYDFEAYDWQWTKTNILRHPNEVTFVMAQHSRPIKPFMLILSVSLASLARLKLGWVRNIWMYVLNNIV
jgi:hypothetical protein